VSQRGGEIGAKSDAATEGSSFMDEAARSMGSRDKADFLESAMKQKKVQ